MSNCMINGARCTKCCEAITLGVNRKDMLTRLFSRRDFLLKYWKPISKRRAKKINPYLFASTAKQQSYKKVKQFFACRALGADGCTQYEDRPYTCSAYPMYGHAKESNHGQWLASLPPEYHPQCTEWPAVIASSTD